MSSADTIKKISDLPFTCDEDKAAVLSNAILHDFGAVTEALYDVDKAMLTTTLMSHASASQKGGLSSKDLGTIAGMANAADERDRAVALAKESSQREAELEPCTLSQDERAALLAKLTPSVMETLETSQHELVKIGMARDSLVEGSEEDLEQEKKMAVLFDRMDTAKRLAEMFEPVPGMRFSERFWQALCAEEDPLQNVHLQLMQDHWEAVDGEAEADANAEA